MSTDIPYIKPWYKKKRFIIPIVFVVLSVLGNLTSGSNSSSSSSNLTVEEQRQKASDDLANKYTVEPAWYPDGFNEYDGNLAWRWGTSKETDCSYSSGSCWSVMLIAKDGCPRSLYGEIKIFDSSDVQIDYTNDSASTVSAMQKVKLTFDTFNDNASTAQIGKFSCY
jgi:hypothetical protein